MCLLIKIITTNFLALIIMSIWGRADGDDLSQNGKNKSMKLNSSSSLSLIALISLASEHILCLVYGKLSILLTFIFSHRKILIWSWDVLVLCLVYGKLSILLTFIFSLWYLTSVSIMSTHRPPDFGFVSSQGTGKSGK